MTKLTGHQRRRVGASLVVAAFAAVYVVWGSTYLAIAWAVETIPPYLMIGVRCLLAGWVLYGWARARGESGPTRLEWRDAAVAGTLLFVTGQAVLAWSETRIASGPAALLVATEPLFIVLLGWKGSRLTGRGGHDRRPTGRTLVALTGGFAGVGVMGLPTSGSHVDFLGGAAALLASASWSVGVFRAGRQRGRSIAQVAGMQLLVGGGILVGLSVTTGEASRLAEVAPSIRSLLSLGYLVIMGSVVTYGAYVWLLERVGPARLSTHAYVNPVVAIVLGAVLGGEAVTAPLVAAMGLILCSVAVLVSRERAAGGNPTPAPRRRRLAHGLDPVALKTPVSLGQVGLDG